MSSRHNKSGGGADLNGEGNHAPHAVGKAGHGLAHPLGVADDHQLGALQPVLVPQQRVLEANTACNITLVLVGCNTL